MVPWVSKVPKVRDQGLHIVQRANPYRQKVKFCCLGLGWNRELLQMDVRHHFGMREML